MTGPNPYQASIDSAVATYGGQPAVIITDAHNRSDMVYKFAAGVAKDLHKPLGIEILPQSQQPLIDAFAAGEITRDQFKNLLRGGSSASPGMLGTPEYFMGAERAEKFDDDLCDMIQSGTKVHAMGTLAGNDKLSSIPEIRALNDEADTLQSRITVDLLKFNRQHEKELADDPKVLFWQQAAEAQAKLGEGEDKDSLLEDLQAIREREGKGEMSPQDYREETAKMLYGQHPLFKEQMAVMDRIFEKFKEKGLTAEDLKPENMKETDFQKNRYAADAALGERAAQVIAERGGIVMIYGAQHTLHDNDVDKSLRDKGIGTMIIDAGLAKPGNPLCLTEVPDARCQANTNVFAEILERIIAHKDPDRYQVDLAVPGDKVTPVKDSPITVQPAKVPAPVVAP